MSASEIINELPKLSEAEQRAILDKLRELVRDGDHSVDLRSRGIDQAQAADLRTRLNSFAEDWERPEASIYDDPPAR
jgi:hypothetical protein